MLTLWLVGRFDRSDTAVIAAQAALVLPGAAVRHFATPDEAARSPTDPPDLVIAVQHRPGEFSPSEIDRLIGSQPLARFVVAVGPWCASCGRSEGAWPETVVIPMWQVQSRLRREAAVLVGRSSGMPVTASREEVMLADTGRSWPWLPSDPIQIVTPDRQFFAVLSEVVREAGATTAGTGSEARVLLMDVDPLDAAGLQRLWTYRNQHPATRTVVLTAMPSPSTVALLRRSGADAVVPKPFDLDELVAAIAP